MRRLSNLDNNVFGAHSHFHTISASSAAGRTLPDSGWFLSWPEHRRAIGRYGDIFSRGFFDEPAAVTTRSKQSHEQDEIWVTNELFKEARPKVEVKDGFLCVYAGRSRTNTHGGVAASETSEVVYRTLLPAGAVLSKLSAKRSGDTLHLVIPKK
ncbi:hypothetical protein EC988_005662 [Linderina pennispora]|nr:hypothetical protein EC988_005662 [Linderina pennispora]